MESMPNFCQHLAPDVAIGEVAVGAMKVRPKKEQWQVSMREIGDPFAFAVCAFEFANALSGCSKDTTRLLSLAVVC